MRGRHFQGKGTEGFQLGRPGSRGKGQPGNIDQLALWGFQVGGSLSGFQVERVENQGSLTKSLGRASVLVNSLPYVTALGLRDSKSHTAEIFISLYTEVAGNVGSPSRLTRMRSRVE